MVTLPLRHCASGNETRAFEVTWGAIICGAYAAAAMSLFLLVFGSGLENLGPIFRIF